VLTALQEQVARIFSALPEAEGFALAGGAALIVRGDVDRATKDLDFFTTAAPTIQSVLPAFERALVHAGLAVEAVQASETFVRLAVQAGDERMEVDIAHDARMRPVESSRLGPVLSGEELAADKLLALFSRAAARDFLDVLALEQHYGLDRMCELAAEKDTGFRPDVLAHMLGRIDRIPEQEFRTDAETMLRLCQAVQRWSARLLQQAREASQPEQGRSSDHNPEL
jgi:hypothetical protein